MVFAAVRPCSPVRGERHALSYSQTFKTTAFFYGLDRTDKPQ